MLVLPLVKEVILPVACAYHSREMKRKKRRPRGSRRGFLIILKSSVGIFIEGVQVKEGAWLKFGTSVLA